VLRHLVDCRTAALGGHVDRCTSCNRIRISYNSCRDRHCPKCQSLSKAEWLEARRQHLLPIPYWHLVFTLPDALRPLALYNKRVIFDLLFATAAATLQTLARDPKHLGAEIGFTAILHTWGQNLQFHPHVHCVVTGGGLAVKDRRWVAARDGFFLPVAVLSRLFRGKFLHALSEARRQGELRGSDAKLDEPSAWKYLGRYTHRVAIANHRLVRLEDGRVTFTLRDHADGAKKKRHTLAAGEFIRRFLLHVLPRRFVRIRHFGLLAGRNIHTRLVEARALLAPDSRTDRGHSRSVTCSARIAMDAWSGSPPGYRRGLLHDASGMET
jgi:hypothetical protein